MNDRPMLPLVVGGVQSEVLFDSGATRSHCDVKYAVRHGVKWRKKSGVVVMQSGKEVNVRGEAVVKFKYAEKWFHQK